MDETLARSGIFQGVDPEAAEALAKEMETTMGLCGVNTIAEVDRHILRDDGRVNWG